MSLQEEELVSSHAGQPEQASSLLDQIMAQTRIQPGSEGYDVARQGVTAFIASILQSTASAEPVNKLAVDSMIADIDERISRQMDVIIHAPAFQQVESFWRSLKTMVDRVDFRENIKVNVLHVTKQELLEDFEFAPEIIQSGFYKHVYSSGFGQFGGEPIAAVLGAYEFKNTAPDMKLLQYVSAVGAMAHAPFLSSVSPEFMGLNSWTELPNIKDLYAIFEGPAYTKWRALRDSEDSRYLGLTAPRFLLRQHYSPTDNPVKNFNYYEDVSQNHEDYLWGNLFYQAFDKGEMADGEGRLTEQYISDYTATWRAGMDNLNIRNFESIGQLTGALEQVISGDQPLQRALTVLRDNTQPGVFSEKLSAKEREEALAEPDYQLLTRLGHEFAPENSTLAVQKDKESTMQAVYQQLTELHRYLLAIQNAPVPGKSALKAVQLRLDQNSSDPIFATRQMAKTLPAPLNRWVGRLADQAWHVVMVEAVHYMEVDWRDSVVKPFNEQLANNYPFNPRSAQDASLDAFERFFKPDGILDTFYQQNLKLFIDNDLSLEDGDNNVIIREDIIAQLETAQKIRDIFFSKQNGLGTSFAVETVSLSGNKRRSVLNLDGQLVDYSQGRNYTAHLVWPNNMREGNESKLTLIGTSGNAPRSISFSGPWAQFRLFGAGQLTGVQDGNFTVRFSVDGGAMTYRVHTDTEDNPFSGGLFSQFGLSDTLY